MTGTDIYNALVGLGVPAMDAKTLSAVAYGESSYNPSAELVTPYEDSVGLFQINMYAHPDKLTRLTGSENIDVWRDWLREPGNNIRAGVEVYNSQGLGAWSVYKNNTYQEYMNDLGSLQVVDTAGWSDSGVGSGVGSAGLSGVLEGLVGRLKGINPMLLIGGLVLFGVLMKRR